MESNATIETLTEVSKFFKDGGHVAIIDGMHLTRQSRQFLATFCTESIYHHLIVEFDSDAKSVETNIKEMTNFFAKQNQDDTDIDWASVFLEKIQEATPLYEKCESSESPMVTVHNSSDPILHSVTARAVQGALQTSILGVLSHPVIHEQLFYFSRVSIFSFLYLKHFWKFNFFQHGESEYNVLGRIGGNADLSPRGWKYGQRLAKFFRENQKCYPGPQLVSF